MRVRPPSRKAWALALAVSLTAHIAVFTAMLAGVEHRRPPPPDEAIQVTLDRPYKPPPPPPPQPPPQPQPVARTPQPRPEPAPATRQPVLQAPPTAPTAPLPAGTPGVGQTPSKAPGGQVAGPSAPGSGVKLNCLGKYIDKMEGKARIDCEQQVYAFIDRNKPNLDPAIDAAKQAAYDAAAGRKAYRRAPVSRLGNDTSTNCPGGNMGMGCASVTIPMISTGDAAQKFRNGDREQRQQ